MNIFRFFNDHNYRFSQYPSCDHLNVALNVLLKDPENNKVAIEEICYAITKVDGYFYDHVKEKLIANGYERFFKKLF